MSQGFYGFPSILGLLRATAFRAVGKAGATAGASLAGGTTSGAPTSGGPFDVGDVIVSRSDGALWVCTVAGTSQGSPGTFVQAGFASPLSTKGDVIAGGTAGAASRLGVGSDSQVLTADSSQTLGVKWAVTPANAGGALTQIASTVLGSSAANITFSGIAGAYSHLQVLLQGRSDAAAAATNINLQLNADTGNNYDTQQMFANATALTATQTLAAAQGTPGVVPAASATSGIASGLDLLILNYGGTTFRKVWRSLNVDNRDDAGSVYIATKAGIWRSTAAITSIKLYPAAGNWVGGTSAQLYGWS